MCSTEQVKRWSAIGAVTLVLLAACRKGNLYASAGTTSAAAPAATDTAGQPAKQDTMRAAAAAGEIAPASDVAQMSDSNIVAALDESDKAEIELARLMTRKATNDSVKAYARKLVADHTKLKKELWTLERKAKLAEIPVRGDTTKAETLHTLQRFRRMAAGKSLDSTFVQQELEDHQHDIADVRAMEDRAKAADLKQLIGNTIAILQTHLSIAQRLTRDYESKSRT